MTRADVRTALSIAGLARVAQDIDRLLKASIRITSYVADEASLPVGGSRLGGLPDLPPGAAWPVGKGEPLGFIAQMRLEEVQPYDTTHQLPPFGMLSFFYDAKQQTFGADPTDRGGWQVLYNASDPSHWQRASAPPSLPATARYRTCAVTFSTELTLPQQPELDLPDLDWTADERARYEQLLSTFPSAADRAAIHNRLLGHPDTLQDDMRLECQLAAHGVGSLSDPRVAQLAGGAQQWQLLLQVDSDEHAGMRWANTGMLYFWIEQGALQSRRFDDVWVILQSE